MNLFVKFVGLVGCVSSSLALEECAAPAGQDPPEADAQTLLQTKVGISSDVEVDHDIGSDVESFVGADAGVVVDEAQCSMDPYGLRDGCLPHWVQDVDLTKGSNSNDVYFEQLVMLRVDDEDEDEQGEEADGKENESSSEESDAQFFWKRRRRRSTTSRRRKWFDAAKAKGQSAVDAAKAKGQSAVDAAKAKGQSAVDAANSAVNNAVDSVTKSVTQGVNNAVTRATTTVMKRVDVAVTFANGALDKINEAVTAVTDAALGVAAQIDEAMGKFITCFSVRTLMLNLFFGGKGGIDMNKTKIDIGLSSRPNFSASIVPTFGGGQAAPSTDASFLASDPLDTVTDAIDTATGDIEDKVKNMKGGLAWSYPQKKHGCVTLAAGANMTFTPELNLSVDALSKTVKMGFSGQVVAKAFVDVQAEGSCTFSHKASFPKDPIQVLGCGPVFCIALILQGIANLDVTAEAKGRANATVTAKYGVSGNVDLKLDTGEAAATVSAGRLTHKEELNYESTFKGTIRLKTGPVFTILPIPGAPISFEPFLKAEIVAHTEATTGQIPCGVAGVNVYADPAVKALGLSGDGSFNSKALEKAIIDEVVRAPIKMQLEVANMLAQCTTLPGADQLISALEKTMSVASDAISKAIPDFEVSFAKPVKLFDKSVCFNVAKVTLPAGATCGSYHVGCISREV